METNIQWYSQLQKDTLTKLTELGINTNRLDLHIGESYIDLCYLDDEGQWYFGGKVDYHVTQDNILGYSPAKINYSTSGAFNVDNAGQVLKTVLAADMLRNWEAVVDVLDGAAKEYDKLRGIINI